MLTRKCAHCGEKIEVSLPYSQKYVFYKTKGKWYHLDCFTVVTTPKIDVRKWIDRTDKYVLTEVSKDDLCQWFYKHYDVCSIPKRIFIKLDSIYKGTFKGLAQPIPPNELYDIIRQKDKYLLGQFTAKHIDGERRIDYALAVAMSSYNSYKAWVAKVEAEQAEANARAKEAISDPNRYKIWGYVEDPFKHDDQTIDYEETID